MSTTWTPKPDPAAAPWSPHDANFLVPREVLEVGSTWNYTDGTPGSDWGWGPNGSDGTPLSGQEGVGPIGDLQDEPDLDDPIPPGETDYEHGNGYWQTRRTPADFGSFPQRFVRLGFRLHPGPALATGMVQRFTMQWTTHGSGSGANMVDGSLSVFEAGVSRFVGPVVQLTKFDTGRWYLYDLLWDASILSNPTGKDVEVEVRMDSFLSGRHGQVGAIRWTPAYKATPWTPAGGPTTIWTEG